MDSYDVVVIGGGPSGLMAGIAAREQGANTLILEKGDKLGRKLGISGGGRCNVTNAKPLPELMQNIPGNGRFLHSVLSQFNNTDIVLFFEGLGIRLKEEDRGRVFPVTDKASTVVAALVDHVFGMGVDVWTDTPVKRILEQDGTVKGVGLMDGRTIQSSAVVVATGGCSVPKTGSTGDAYPWARKLGHTVVDPYPTEVPLTSDDRFIQSRALQGLSLQNVSVTIRTTSNKRLTTEIGDMIFTHFGLSGPVALRCSHYVSTHRRRGSMEGLVAEIDLVPSHTKDELLQTVARLRKAEAKKHVSNVLPSLIPERLADVVLQALDLDGATQMANVSNDQVSALVARLKAFPVGITGTLPLAQATVTGGGVSTKDIHPNTMASKRCQGLYFCGEVMDVHAHTGGYNITVAFSTGHVAGQNAAQYSLQKQVDLSTRP